MATYLRHVPTGDLYIFTGILAKRDDMEVVEETEDEAAPAPATEKTAAELKAELKALGVEFPGNASKAKLMQLLETAAPEAEPEAEE